MDHADLIETTATDGRALLAAAEANWSQHVPHCPEWDAAALVRHTGGIFAWMSAVVGTGEFVNMRTIEPAPDTDSALADWYTANLDRTLGIFRDTNPDAEVWTFSSLGEQRAAWWSRRLAIEVAIHRWDAQHAAGIDPAPLAQDVAVAGIGEFVAEFLPGLLERAGDQRPAGVLRLKTTDGPTDTRLDLDQRGVPRDDLTATTTSIHGSASDILLWMTNRDTAALVVDGDRDLLTKWAELQR